MLVNEDPSKLQFFIYLLKDSVMFEMHFTPSKCRMLLYGWINSKPDLVPAGKQLGELNRSGCLGVRTSTEACLRIKEAGLTWA